MYVHEEHVHNNVIKKWLKCQYCDEKESAETQATNDSDAGSDEQEQRSIAFERQGISQLAQNLIQAVDEEEAVVAEEMMHSALTTDPFTRIPISDLLNYSRAEE
jgi:restriction endonuclease Mrr